MNESENLTLRFWIMLVTSCFNRSGAVVQDMPRQAENLVSGIERDLGRERWESEWKYVSIMIGGNNLCVVCNSTSVQSAKCKA